jgi:hypothetical protein
MGVSIGAAVCFFLVDIFVISSGRLLRPGAVSRPGQGGEEAFFESVRSRKRRRQKDSREHRAGFNDGSKERQIEQAEMI